MNTLQRRKQQVVIASMVEFLTELEESGIEQEMVEEIGITLANIAMNVWGNNYLIEHSESYHPAEVIAFFGTANNEPGFGSLENLKGQRIYKADIDEIATAHGD